MAKLECLIHARHRVTEFISENELDRLAQQACDAAEKSPGWQPGEEFIFEIEDEEHRVAEVEMSALIVCHKGTGYEVFYYDGMMAETIQNTCSWDR